MARDTFLVGGISFSESGEGPYTLLYTCWARTRACLEEAHIPHPAHDWEGTEGAAFVRLKRADRMSVAVVHITATKVSSIIFTLLKGAMRTSVVQ